jgi:hypothetical protein
MSSTGRDISIADSWLDHLRRAVGAALPEAGDDADAGPEFEAFLERQLAEGLSLADASDLVEIIPLGPHRPPRRYVVRFRCKGLVRSDDGTVAEANRFEVGVWFRSNYLRHADAFETLSWLCPTQIWHPNIRTPLICVGRLGPGTPLVDIVYQCFEIITFNKVTMLEHDSLNRDACSWSRRNQHLFPIDRRPLKRRTVDVQIDPTPGRG